MDGPLLIFDKSALQLLSVDESAWLDNFFQSVITPLFYVETIADLEKKMLKDRTAEQEVKLIAARMPEQQTTPSVHHSTLIASELAGFFKLATDRAKRVLPQGQPVMLGDSKGIIYRDAPEEEALRRWQEGQFIELEHNIAKKWRAALAETDNGVLYESFKRVYERNPKPKDLPSLKAFVDATLARAPDDWFLGFVLELVGASDEEKASVRQRWEAEGKPPIRNFLPYFVHVFTVDLFFYLGIAADLISRNRALGLPLARVRQGCELSKVEPGERIQRRTQTCSCGGISLKFFRQCAKQGANPWRLRISHLEQPFKVTILCQQGQGLLNGAFGRQFTCLAALA
jgi:hypothetical protein